MKLISVKTKKQMRDFVYLPQKLHGNNENYVPPLWIYEKKAYYGKSNPILKNSVFELFLLIDNGIAIGRTLAYIDFNHNKYYKINMGFFGAFECIDNQKAGQILVNAAEVWLKEKGMDSIRGPINPVAENWGFVYEGYDSPPMFMSPWNPPYYHKFFKDYKKAKDLLLYEADMRTGYRMPERYNGFFDKFLKRYPTVTFRRINMRNIKADVKSILDISNASLANNWGFVPLELPVMEDMLKKLKLIVDRDAVWIVEANGEAIGFCLGFPDINIIFKETKGKLFPTGWYKLLFGSKKIKEYRLFGLAVHPDWQGKGLDAIMYINLYKHLLKKNILMEANYILEDNYRIRNALEKLGMSYIKTYRVYEKSLNR